MFRYNKGAFEIQGISVKFPDNYGIGVDIEGWYDENSLAAFEQEEHYCIEWKISSRCEDTEKELIEIINDAEGFKKLSPIEPFEHNNLKGHQALYKSGREQYFERRYDLGEGNQLVFLITAITDIKAILGKQEIQDLLDGINRKA